MCCRSLFVLFLLAIVLAVLFRFTDSDYSFHIFKLFVQQMVSSQYILYSRSAILIAFYFFSYSDSMHMHYFKTMLDCHSRKCHVTTLIDKFIVSNSRLITLRYSLLINNISVISWRSVVLVEGTRILA